MVSGHEDTWVVKMEAEEGTDQRWTEATTECVDFDLSVSSDLSEERSDEDSEEILKEESDEPCITVPMGCDLHEGAPEDGIDSEGDESEIDEVSVMTEVVGAPEGELEENENLNFLFLPTPLLGHLRQLSSLKLHQSLIHPLHCLFHPLVHPC